jgi:hypothetical protein
VFGRPILRASGSKLRQCQKATHLLFLQFVFQKSMIIIDFVAWSPPFLVFTIGKRGFSTTVSIHFASLQPFPRAPRFAQQSTAYFRQFLLEKAGNCCATCSGWGGRQLLSNQPCEPAAHVLRVISGRTDGSRR